MLHERHEQEQWTVWSSDNGGQDLKARFSEDQRGRSPKDGPGVFRYQGRGRIKEIGRGLD
jgi:hypothetical protein